MLRRSFFASLVAGVAGLFVGMAVGKTETPRDFEFEKYYPKPSPKPVKSAWQCARCGRGNPIARDFCPCGKPVPGLYYDCDMTEEWEAYIKTRPPNWVEAWGSTPRGAMLTDEQVTARLRRLKAMRRVVPS